MCKQHPNAAHIAISELEKRLKPQGRKVTVVTQNIDRLHHMAGSQNIIELHGGCDCVLCVHVLALLCGVLVLDLIYLF